MNLKNNRHLTQVVFWSKLLFLCWNKNLLNTSKALLYFKILGNTEKKVLWKYIGLLAKELVTPITIDNSLSPPINSTEIRIFVSYLKESF